jgi:hypothetical protein
VNLGNDPKNIFPSSSVGGAAKLSYSQVQIFLAYELIGRKGNNEDSNNDSNLGVTAHGVRPNGATRERDDAGADERNADDCAGEGEEEDASRAGAEQTAGKT